MLNKSSEHPVVGLGNWIDQGNGEFAGSPVHVSATPEFVAHAAESRTRHDLMTWMGQALHFPKPSIRK